MIEFITMNGARFLCEPETLLGVLEVRESIPKDELGVRPHVLFFLGASQVKIAATFDEIKEAFAAYDRLLAAEENSGDLADQIVRDAVLKTVHEPGEARKFGTKPEKPPRQNRGNLSGS